jgi:hypothetical protein
VVLDVLALGTSTEIVGATICGSPQRIPCLDTARGREVEVLGRRRGGLERHRWARARAGAHGDAGAGFFARGPTPIKNNCADGENTSEGNFIQRLLSRGRFGATAGSRSVATALLR